MLEVKICGVTNSRDANIAAEHGANYVGTIYVPKTPRVVTPDDGYDIHYNLRGKGVKLVAVVAYKSKDNRSYDNLRRIVDKVNPNVIQLHGEEQPEFCEKIKGLVEEIWKVFKIRDEDDFELIKEMIPDYCYASKIVLDTYVEGKKGGTGETFNWDLLKGILTRGEYRYSKYNIEFGKRIILAGGLIPENVAEGVRTVRPYGVDTSSGVQVSKDEKRMKDPEKIKMFIENARTAEAGLGYLS